MAAENCEAPWSGVSVSFGRSAKNRAKRPPSHRRITTDTCFPILPISDLSRLFARLFAPKKYGVKRVGMSDGNIGCPHEEGKDFPVGGDCPFCPWWKGKQGSGAKE